MSGKRLCVEGTPAGRPGGAFSADKDILPGDESLSPIQEIESNQQPANQLQVADIAISQNQSAMVEQPTDSEMA